MTDPTFNEPSAPLPPSQTVQPQQATNTLSIVAFVLSLSGFVFLFIGFIGGIVCGHIALSQIKRSHESGRGFAIAALVIGYVMVVVSAFLTVLVVLLVIAAILHSPSPHHVRV